MIIFRWTGLDSVFYNGSNITEEPLIFMLLVGLWTQLTELTAESSS